jgi:hypothetical protein
VNPRTTGILFLVAAALGAFVYFYEVRGGPEREEAERQAKRLFPGIEAGDVESISVTTTDGKEARVARVEGAWRVLAPIDFPGDPTALDGMANALASLESETVLEEPQPLAVYGLVEPARTVRFVAKGEEKSLRVGKKSPVGANSYAATAADKPVYAVPTFRVQTLEKSLDDLRDKRVLVFDREQVQRIRVAWLDGGVLLEKADDGWKLLEPVVGPADATTVQGLLSSLSFLRAKSFVDAPPPDAELGLAKPELEVTLEGAPAAEGGLRPAWRLAIGSLLPEKERAARGAGTLRYRIAEERLQDYPRDVTSYRFKELAKFVATDAKRFELVFHDAAGGATVVVTGVNGENGWETSPEKMAEGTPARLVAELARLEAKTIEADSMGPAELAALGLAPPAAVVRVFGAAAEGETPAPLAEVHFGAADASRGIAARTPGSDIVYRIDYGLAEHLPVSLEAFRSRFVAAAEPAEPEPAAEPAAEEGGAPEAPEPAEEPSP